MCRITIHQNITASFSGFFTHYKVHVMIEITGIHNSYIKIK